MVPKGLLWQPGIAVGKRYPAKTVGWGHGAGLWPAMAAPCHLGIQKQIKNLNSTECVLENVFVLWNLGVIPENGTKLVPCYCCLVLHAQCVYVYQCALFLVLLQTSRD